MIDDTHGDGASGPGTSGAATAALEVPVTGASAAGSMSITLKLYATLQDLLPAGTKRNAAKIEVAGDASLNDIIDAYRVPRELAHLVLVNGVFVCDTDRDARNALKPDDVLAIWPPVAGG